FGCDDCQTVCPWNRKARAADPLPDPELAWPDLEGFFGISNRAFARRYAGSAFVRSGRAALARNALIVLANRDPEALARLLPAALADPSERVRATAAAAAARTGRAAQAAGARGSLGEAARGYVNRALELFG
ncbi:MAG TPA: tRNA epoxyqueuosine(34) reductase QueG, partial [Oceanithermus profundus]|nr:tRNA epoxyqueuosine(34) reductase QueG [Oceanithermus profundus]